MTTIQYTQVCPTLNHTNAQLLVQIAAFFIKGAMRNI